MLGSGGACPRGLRDQSVADRVDRNGEAFQCPNAQRHPVALLAEHDIVGGFEPFSAYDRVADLARQPCPGSRAPAAVPPEAVTKVRLRRGVMPIASGSAAGSHVNSDPVPTSAVIGSVTIFSFLGFTAITPTLNAFIVRLPERVLYRLVVGQG